MRKVFLTAVMALLFAAGCNSESKKTMFNQIEANQEESVTLKLEVERLQKANEELTGQVESLTSIGREVRLGVLERITGIEIASRSGFFDKDKDGTKESLVVYVRTIDDAGDAVKAAGGMDVELWDLEAESNARLAEWKVGPEELKMKWASTVMTNYFRLRFDVIELLKDADAEELTVKVTFTDYISGKVLRKQAVIKR